MGILRDKRDVEKEQKQQAALAAYIRIGEVGPAMREIGMHRATWYRWIEEDPDFAQAVAEAEQEVLDIDKAEVRRRAVEGVDEPVGWFRGEPGGYVRKYSDNLLMFRVKAKDPEYRDRQTVDLNTTGQPDSATTATLEELKAMLIRLAIEADKKGLLLAVGESSQGAGN